MPLSLLSASCPLLLLLLSPSLLGREHRQHATRLRSHRLLRALEQTLLHVALRRSVSSAGRRGERLLLHRQRIHARAAWVGELQRDRCCAARIQAATRVRITPRTERAACRRDPHDLRPLIVERDGTHDSEEMERSDELRQSGRLTQSR